MISIAHAIALSFAISLSWISAAHAGFMAIPIAVLGGITGWGIAANAALVAASIYSGYRTQRKAREMQNRQLSTGGGGFAASQFYAFSGISTVRDAMGAIIHVVLGTHRTGGLLVQIYTRREGGIDYLYMLLAISMGEVSDIRDVELNNESITNFSGASYQIRKGTHDQTAIDWFRDINTQYTQSGKRVLSTTQITYTVAQNCDRVRIRFSMPHGFGTIFSTTYEVGGSVISGGYPYPHHVSAVTITSSGMTTVVADPYNYLGGNTAPVNFEIELTGPFTAGQVLYFSKPYTWGTDDHDGESYGNTGGPGTITVYDYIEIAHVVETTFGTGEGYTYPDVALLAIRCPSTNTLTSEPECTAICDGVLCTLPGYLDTPTFTKNPAPQLYTLLTSELFGGGDYYKQAAFDLATWVTAAQRFDEIISDGAGGTEKRMETNLVLDSQFLPRELREMFEKLTGSRIFRIRGQYRWFLDIEQTVPSMLFTDGNIDRGSLSWTSTDSSTLYESIAVRFRDEYNGYEERVIEIPYTEGSTKKVPQLTTDLFGITKMSRATRQAILLLREARMRDGQIKLKGKLDSIACEPGDLVYLGDKEQDQISTGNIIGFGPDYIVLPEEVTFSAGSNYDVIVTLKSGAVQTMHVLMSGPAPKNMSDVTSDIVFLTETFATIGSDPRDHSGYSLGLSTNAKEDYIVHSIRRTSVSDIEIAAVKYDSSMWDGVDDTVVTDTESLVAYSENRAPQQVTNLTLTEKLTTAASGEIISNILVSFTPPQDSPGWEYARIYLNLVYADQPVVGYQYFGTSTGQTTIPNMPYGVEIGVIAQSVSGSGLYASYDDAPEETITPAGIAGTPEDVTGLIALQQGASVLVQWTGSSDIITRSYEVRRGLTWGGAATVYTGEPNEFRDWNVANDTYRYWVAGVSSTGAYSSNKASAVVTVTNIPNANIVFEDSEYSDDWDGTLENFVKVDDGLGGNYLQSFPTAAPSVLDTATNRATGGTPSASTSETGHEALYAFDGSTATYWASASLPSPGDKYPAYLYYNIAREIYVTTVKIYAFAMPGGSPFVKDFAIEASNDGVSYSEIHSATFPNTLGGGWSTFTVTNPGWYRYVRLKLIDSYHGSTVPPRVSEFQIIGNIAEPYTATYTTLPYDLGRVDSAYFWLWDDIDWQILNGKISDYWGPTDTMLAPFDDVNEPISEAETSGTHIIEQRFSQDNVTWSEWQLYRYGAYTQRYVQYRVSATITSEALYITIRELATRIDVQDVIMRIDSIVIAPTGTTITFANYTDTQGRVGTFYNPPIVNTQLVNTGKSLAPDVINTTTTECTIKAYNASNVAESAIATVVIQGY